MLFFLGGVRVTDLWIKQMRNLINQGLSDEEIIKQVPFRSEWVINERQKILMERK